MNGGVRILPHQNPGASMFEGLYSIMAGGWQGMVDKAMNDNPKFPPLDVLPCANVHIDKNFVCEKPGKLPCSSCQLVSYCSEECQRAHWPIHKSDCEDPIRSDDWKPAWIVENRPPSFFLKPNTSTTEEFAKRFQDEMSTGASLWGNVPAMDIINLPNNEKDPKNNLSLAFVASGDIRNLVATVNALGSDYSGKMTILLNDRNPHVVSRNIALLLILGTIPDETIAADMALHFWYSLFLPMQYRLRILLMVSTLLKKTKSSGPIIAPLGPQSKLTCHVSDDVRRLLVKNAGPSMSPEQAQTEYQLVRHAPSRVDFRDRMYMGLKPSHRLAFLEYRRFGVILPFGAVNAHCNMPNPSLFADGAWLQTDYADPLESWDLDKVFTAGNEHGAQPEDVYGSLYFFLSDQLRAFARNIRHHRISFHVFSAGACALAQNIAQGKYAKHGLAPFTRFHRIDVSNIMDPNYAGIKGVMNAWGPLLAKTDHAALTGYFMNWVGHTPEGRVSDAGESAVKDAMDLMKRSNRLRSDLDPTLTVHFAMDDIDAFYDTSEAFSKFWKAHGGADVELRMRKVNKIIPQRLRTALGAKPDALPDVGDDEAWYRDTRLTNRTWTERYVEFSHK